MEACDNRPGTGFGGGTVEMRAAILSIGSELMHGYLTDTNATFLTQEMNALGIEPVSVTQVGDDLARIVTTFRRALDDADLVVATGGIGPTDDDLTREAVAEVCGEQVEVDEQIADGIRRFFTMRGSVMPEQNTKQAWMIPSAESLANPMGTAPGWFVRQGEKRIVIMPGVPREMFRMWREQAVPRVLAGSESRAIVSRTLKTIGIGESAVEKEIYEVIRRGHPTVATYAKDDGVHVRITAITDDPDSANAAVEQADREIRAIVGQHVYGYLDDPIATVILRAVAASGGTLAVWEAGNAGHLSVLLEESDLSDAVVVDARTTSFEAALHQTGASDDPESVAIACATMAAQRSGTALGASVVVRLSPGENPDRATGEVAIALALNGQPTVRRNTISAIPQEIRRRATLQAVDFLWSSLRDGTTLHQG
jgi:nicotinamide-nucleotide amidase